jgi:hypothetical protein
LEAEDLNVEHNKKLFEVGDIVKIKRPKSGFIFMKCKRNNLKSDKIYYLFEDLKSQQTTYSRKPFKMQRHYTRGELIELINLNELTLIEDIAQKAHLLLKYF